MVVNTPGRSAAGIGSDSWVVVATMGHYDEEALEAALVTDAAYVGLVASRSRRNAVVQALRRRGWSGDALGGHRESRGTNPGRFAEEIALSVLADIVDRRNRRKLRAKPAARAHARSSPPIPCAAWQSRLSSAMYRLAMSTSAARLHGGIRAGAGALSNSRVGG